MEIERNDPYQPPSYQRLSPSFSSLNSTPPTAAPLSIRFANVVIDRIVIAALLYASGMLAVLHGPQPMAEALIHSSALTDIVISLLFSIAYYTIVEGLFGRTLGKLITRTKVIDETGCKPAFNKNLLRTLCRFIPLEPLSYLASGQRGWHDSLSGTWVVRTGQQSTGEQTEL